jgi:hypothetical protein
MPTNFKISQTVAEINQSFQELRGRLSIGSETTPISNAELKGDHLRFLAHATVEGQSAVMEFAGHVSGDRIAGRMKVSRGGVKSVAPWKAKRKSRSQVSDR